MTVQRAPGRPAGAFKRIFTDYGIVIALIAIIGFFSVMRPDTFPTIANFGSILQANASIMFIAFGLMLPLIVGHFDLSVAAMAGFGGVLATGLMSNGTVSQWPLAVLIVVVVAVVVGLINGFLVAYLNLNALVVTLGTQSVLFGAILWYSKGAVIYSGIPQAFKDLGQDRPLGIPLPFIFAVAVGIVLWYVLYFRPVGRRLYAIGGSRDAARLTGIKVDQLTVGAFVGGAVLAAVGGVLQVAQVGSAAPTSGSEFLLPAIAACFLGETSIRRGYYNVWGTMTAVVLVAAGTTGLFMLGAQTWVQPVFNGVVLIGAILAAKVGVLKTRARKARPRTPTAPPTPTVAAAAAAH
ncbi:ABC transporter permease [Rhodococcus opacus]|uniref:ABC transporter permease n=1 Tax=Rhodococcus opacus TaxID=37919 RepID=UPI0002F72F4A|nr:ABC transporter permease [Rhodococcus opacus]AHK29085.1 Ribose transport system permease protein rbsC [Rhodococcus opacus PD630]RZK84999.1 MAG: ABC transporter permease [Rhodococcus sp. (in: high G+C Gram-positive bacteria)]UDG98901.1 ABC transporter permease [Rhodococcus opacus PD630]